MKLKSVLLEKPIRFAASAEDVWEQGGNPPRLLQSDRYELELDPATQLVHCSFKGQLRLVHASRVECMEAFDADELLEQETAPTPQPKGKGGFLDKRG